MNTDELLKRLIEIHGEYCQTGYTNDMCGCAIAALICDVMDASASAQHGCTAAEAARNAQRYADIVNGKVSEDDYDRFQRSRTGVDLIKAVSAEIEVTK